VRYVDEVYVDFPPESLEGDTDIDVNDPWMDDLNIECVVPEVSVPEVFSTSLQVECNVIESNKSEMCYPLVPMTNTNFVSCALSDGSKMLALVDTGATRSYISRSLIESSKFLQSVPIKEGKPCEVMIGDGSSIMITKYMHIPVQLSACCIMVSAWVLECNSPVQLVLGVDAQEEYRTVLDCYNHTMNVTVPNIDLKFDEDVCLRPGQRKDATICVIEYASFMYGPFEVQMYESVSSMTYKNVIAEFREGKATITLFNDSKEEIFRSNKDVIGCIVLTTCIQSYLPCVKVEKDKSQRIGLYFGAMMTKDEVISDAEVGSNEQSRHMVIIDEGENKIDSAQDLSVDESLLSSEELKEKRLKEYPWLDPNDFRLKLSKRDIIKRLVNISDSKFNAAQQQELIESLVRNSACISLFGEIGCLKRWAVDISLDLIDPTISFSASPYITSADDIAFTKQELRKLVQLGIFEPRLATVTSSLFLVRRTPTTKPRIVCDLRRLNNVTKQVHRPGTTIRSFCRTFGRKKYSYLSCLDIRSAYHSVRVVGHSSDYLGVVSYPGAPALSYKRMAMGLRNASVEFSQIIDRILSDLTLEQHESIIDYLDDLLVFSVTPEEHLQLLNDIFSLFQKVGLVLSLDKCYFVPKNGVEFLGYDIRFSPDGEHPQLCVKQSRIDALLAMKRPETKTEIKRFLGSCQYIAMFLQSYQLIVYPLTKLLKKAVEFNWGTEQEEAWLTMKRVLSTPPFLSFPNEEGRFVLATDASRQACGSVLFQMQYDESENKEIPKLIGYASRVLSHINCLSYSVTELEMTALLYGCASFRHFLGNRHFYALTDHKALQFIFSNSAEFATARIRRLYWKLLEYQFTLLYVKGDSPLLAMADLLSRHPNDLWQKEDYYVVPISLREKEMAENDSLDSQNNIWFVDETFQGTVMQENLQSFMITHFEFFENFKGVHTLAPVMTRSMTRKLRESDNTEAVVDVSDASIELSVPTIKEVERKDVISTPTDLPVTKSSQTVSLPPRNEREVPREISSEFENTSPVAVTVNTNVGRMVNKIFSADNPPPIILTRAPHQRDLEPSIRKYFTDVMSHVKVPRSKIEIQVAQKNDVFLGPIVNYLRDGKLTGEKPNAKSIVKLSEQFALIDDLLYRVTSSSKHERTSLQLTLPEDMVIEVLDFYHTTFLGVHLRMFKLYSLVKGFFYIKNLFNHVIVYVRSCLQCQRLSSDAFTDKDRPYKPRLLIDSKPFATVHMDIMIFPISQTSIKFCLVLQCEMTRFLIGVPLLNKDAKSVCDALLSHLIMPYFIPDRIITDMEPSFRGQLVSALHKSLGIELHFVKPMGHGSLVVERALQTIRNYLISMIEYRFSQWPKLIQSAIKAYNITPLVELKYSPSYLVFLREESSFMTYQSAPLSMLTYEYDEYVTFLKERLAIVREGTRKLHNAVKIQQANAHVARISKIRSFLEGELVLLRSPRLTGLQSSQKLVINYIGPLYVLRVVDENSVLLSTIDNRELSGQFHVARLKPVVLRGRQGEKLTSITQLRAHFNKASLQKVAMMEVKGKHDGVTVELELNDVVCDADQLLFCLGMRSLESSLMESQEQSIDYIDYCCVDLLAVDTGVEGFVRKWRFKNGHLQVYVDCVVPEWGQWFTMYQEPLLLSLVLQVKRDEVVGTPNRRVHSCLY